MWLTSHCIENDFAKDIDFEEVINLYYELFQLNADGSTRDLFS